MGDYVILKAHAQMHRNTRLGSSRRGEKIGRIRVQKNERKHAGKRLSMFIYTWQRYLMPDNYQDDIGLVYIDK